MGRRSILARQSLRAVVAIPAKDEAARIAPCLDALARQRPASGTIRGTFEVVLFVNNSADATAAIARSLAPSLPFRLHLVHETLDQEHATAGMARRIAMDLAADRLTAAGSAAEGLILTTDADSRVAPNWIDANLAAIDAGADAVAGTIRLDPDEEAALSPALRGRGALEGRYEALLVELAARLDPVPHDPYPCHATASGASLAVRLSTYRAIGGLPPLPVGEDRALMAALLAHDARVRHAPEVGVITSGRLFGRAPGGAADAMRERTDDPDAPCDAALEPVASAVIRAAWRARLRRSHAESGRLDPAEGWGRGLRVSGPVALDAARAATFGAAWARLEAASPSLRRRALRPSELPPEIRAAGAALNTLRAPARIKAPLSRPAGRRADTRPLGPGPGSERSRPPAE